MPAARRFQERTRIRIVLLGAFAYIGLVALTLCQALRGQPVTAPDPLTIAGFSGLLLLVTVGAAGIAYAAKSGGVLLAPHQPLEP